MEVSASAPSVSYIIDASVAVKWFSRIDEKSLEQALRLQELHLKRKCLLTCPYLLIYEVTNALRYNPYFKQKDTEEALKSLFKMELNLVEPQHKGFKKAISLAYQKGLTIYDASYIALAQEHQTFLVTADNKFYQKVKDLPHVNLLSSLEL